MNFYRNDFYMLIIRLLNSIEDNNYLLMISRVKNITANDINNKKISIYDKYVVVNKNKKLIFEDYAKTEEYYDFNYYRTDSTYFDTSIITINQIKNIILQNSINYPYLTILYKILINLYSNYKYEPIKLNIEMIINLVEEYADEEKKLSNKILQRKKEND